MLLSRDESSQTRTHATAEVETWKGTTNEGEQKKGNQPAREEYVLCESRLYVGLFFLGAIQCRTSQFTAMPQFTRGKRAPHD